MSKLADKMISLTRNKLKQPGLGINWKNFIDLPSTIGYPKFSQFANMTMGRAAAASEKPNTVVVTHKKQLKEDKGEIVVLLGGDSAEREVSLKSGQAVITALQQEGIAVKPIDPAIDGIECLANENISRVFIALHGRGGEDGTIQGYLEALGIPYTGSGVLASALAMDKCRTKQAWNSIGLPTPAFVELHPDSDYALVDSQVGYPCVVKPTSEGSSVGISIVNDAKELKSALESAFDFDESVLVESWIDGDEYTVSILSDFSLPVIRITTPETFYTYEAKYEAETTQYFCPSGLEDHEEVSMQELALKAFQSIGCRSWGRVDIMRDKSGVCWLLEVNTVPGMTDHSLVPMAAEHAGISFNELVLSILLEASCEQQRRRARK